MTGPSITIKDVAALAGVSAGHGVKGALRQPGNLAAVPAKGGRRVAELDFHPNAQARALRSTRTNVIGLLLSDIRNPFFADLAHAAEQAALAEGLVTLLGNANESIPQQDRYLDTFISQRVDGVIAAPQGEGSSSLRALLERDIPTVFVDRTVDGVDVPSVTTDSDTGIRQAVEHLARQGHERVGYIAGPQTTSTGRDRLESFSRAAREFGLSTDPALTYFGDFQSASGSAGAHHLLGLAQPPTALLAADSPMAVGALATLNRKGLRIGRDMALIAFDDIEWFSLLDPPLTVISHDVEAMGRTAVRLLLEVIDGQKPGFSRPPSELDRPRLLRHTRTPAWGSRDSSGPLPSDPSDSRLGAPSDTTEGTGPMSTVFVVGSLDADQNIRVHSLPRAGEPSRDRTQRSAPAARAATRPSRRPVPAPRVKFTGAVGDDAHGRRILEVLSGAGDRRRPRAGRRHRRDGNGGHRSRRPRARTRSSSARARTPGSPPPTSTAGLAAMRAGDVLVLQLEIPTALVRQAAGPRGAAGRSSSSTPPPPPGRSTGLLDDVDLLVVNEQEIQVLAGLAGVRRERTGSWSRHFRRSSVRPSSAPPARKGPSRSSTAAWCTCRRRQWPPRTPRGPATRSWATSPHPWQAARWNCPPQ